MKTLKSVLLFGIAILLSGCYTQLQYQQAADKRSSGQQGSSYEQERAADSEYATVKESARRQVRQGDYDRRARVGYYYVGGERPHYPYYYQDDYFYGGYFGSSWLSYEHYVNWSPSYYRYHSGFHPYFARWQWGSYFRHAHMPYSGPWFSVSFGYGRYYPHYRWHDMYAFHPWSYGYGWNNIYYNNYYFLDDGYAWYDSDDRARNARYGMRSTGTSRLGANGALRGDRSGVRSGGALNSGSSSATRIRGGSAGTTRSNGDVTRTRSGSTSRSGSTGSSGSTRKRGGNDQGVQDDGQDKREDVQRTRTVYLGATNVRTLPETSRSTDLYSREDRMQRVRPMYTSGNDFSWSSRTMQERLQDQRVEPMEMRPTTRDRGGFLQKLGRFFESSRSSYDHIWDRQGDRGGVNRDRDRDRGSVNRGSTGSDTRSRSGSSGSRSRGSGGGDDDGSSRNRGGGN